MANLLEKNCDFRFQNMLSVKLVRNRQLVTSGGHAWFSSFTSSFIEPSSQHQRRYLGPKKTLDFRHYSAFGPLSDQFDLRTFSMEFSEPITMGATQNMASDVSSLPRGMIPE